MQAALLGWATSLQETFSQSGDYYQYFCWNVKADFTKRKTLQNRVKVTSQ